MEESPSSLNNRGIRAAGEGRGQSAEIRDTADADERSVPRSLRLNLRAGNRRDTVWLASFDKLFEFEGFEEAEDSGKRSSRRGRAIFVSLMQEKGFGELTSSHAQRESSHRLACCIAHVLLWP